MRLIDTEAALDALATDWERLAARPGHGVFNGWSWNRLWWAHYGYLGTLHVLVVSRGTRVCGIAPFYHTRTRVLRGIPLTTLRLLGSGGDTSPDDLDVLAAEGCDQAVTDALCAYLLGAPTRRFARFELRDLSAASMFAERFVARAIALGHVAPSVSVATRLVGTLPDSAEAWRAGSGRNARKQRRRRLNRLDELGRVGFALCDSPAAIDRAHAALVRLHRARRASLGEAGGFGSSDYIGFHLALMHALHARGELRLGVLALDDEPIAVEYAFAVDGTLAFFQTGFDPDRAALAPGHLLMSWMIEQAIASGLRRIDLLKGDYAYKSRYAADRRESRSIELYTHPMLARLMRLWRRRRPL